MYDCGVYQILNKKTNNIYIGASPKLKQRKHAQMSKLVQGVHTNIFLQSDYNKYGKENFVFEHLIYCDSWNLRFYEQRFSDGLKPAYNKRILVHSNLGLKLAPLSEEHKKKISEAQKGKPRKPHTEETRRKISLAHKGYVKSPEHCKNLALASAKLTEGQVVEILKDSISTHEELTKKYGVSKSCIFSIRQRITWKHIKEPAGFKRYDPFKWLEGA